MTVPIARYGKEPELFIRGDTLLYFYIFLTSPVRWTSDYTPLACWRQITLSFGQVLALSFFIYPKRTDMIVTSVPL